MEFLVPLMGIFMINVVLSGDNAVVIAMASRNLPARQQRKAILIGSAGAIVFRIILTVIIVSLLKIPYLQAVGGLLLVYVAVKLLRDEESPSEEGHTAGSLFEAVKIIIFADILMSLDNTLAIAAVSNGNWLLLIIGLATSIPIIIFCSQLILYLMRKFPVIVQIGAAILAWTAGKMLVEDKQVGALLHGFSQTGINVIEVGIPLFITAAVLLYGWFANKRARNAQKEAC